MQYLLLLVQALVERAAQRLNMLRLQMAAHILVEVVEVVLQEAPEAEVGLLVHPLEMVAMEVIT
jgi:IS4 transposase